MLTESFQTEVDVNIISKLVLENIDLSGKLYDYISFEKTTIDWGFSVDLDRSGIDSILFAAPDQTITLEGLYTTELHPDKEESFSIQVDVKDIKLDNIDNRLKENSSITPSEIDYFEGKWTLEF